MPRLNRVNWEVFVRGACWFRFRVSQTRAETPSCAISNYLNVLILQFCFLCLCWLSLRIYLSCVVASTNLSIKDFSIKHKYFFRLFITNFLNFLYIIQYITTPVNFTEKKFFAPCGKLFYHPLIFRPQNPQNPQNSQNSLKFYKFAFIHSSTCRIARPRCETAFFSSSVASPKVFPRSVE